MRYFIILLFSVFTCFGQQLAFPGAKGAGRFTTGGRGGTVYEVTNLNTSGAGSFTEAITASGARYIVFKVAGEITYADGYDLTITNGNFTIAGETAPGDGISIRGAQVQIHASNWIIRHIRIRQSSGSPEDDCLRMVGFGTEYSNAIVDHVSVSYSSDENIAIQDYTNVTIQNCISSDSKGAGNLILVKGNGNGPYTIVDNLFVWNQYRNPITGGTLDLEYVNNLSYGQIGNMLNEWGANVDVIGNHWDNNTSTPSSTINLYQGNAAGGTVGNTNLYYTDNLFEGGAITVDTEYESGTIEVAPIHGTVTARPVSELESYVLANAGARRGISGLDTYDQSLVDDVTNNVASGYNSVVHPTLSAGTTPTDSDSDGMWDVAEIALFGSIAATNDPNGDVLSDGYDNIENTFHYLAGYSYSGSNPVITGLKKNFFNKKKGFF